MSSASENNKTLFEWMRKSFCINSQAMSMVSPPYSRQHPNIVRLLSSKSVQDGFENIELSPASSFARSTQTEAFKDQDTPKAYSSRAKEIVASRIGSYPSPDGNFNRFDPRNKSEPIGSLATRMEKQKAKTDLEIMDIIQRNEDFYFDDDFACDELPPNLQLIGRPDDQLDMSAFHGLENLFEKTFFDTPELAEMSFNDKEELMKRRESMGTFIEYLGICPEPDAEDLA